MLHARIAARAFNTPLPRVRISPIGAFDPTRYL